MSLRLFLPSSYVDSQTLREMFGVAEGEGENGQDGIEAAVGDVQAGVHDVQVVVVVDAAPLVRDGS